MTDKKVQKLKYEDFKNIVRNTPLISIDLIVFNKDNQVLLGYRKNEPAKDTWFVPGGVIYKNEKISHAFSRTSLDELGVAINIDESDFMGVYEHFYNNNFDSDPEFGTHYIVLAYKVKINILINDLPDDQHDNYRWFEVNELLTNEKVHENTKAYFKNVKK